MGTTIRLTLSTAAAVKVTITHRIAGHKVGPSCKPNAKRGKSCSLVSAVKTLHFMGLAGDNKMKLLIKSLRPGSYSVTISASNPGGTSDKITLNFKIRPKG